MTKSFTLHRSNGVRVSPYFQNVEWREKRRKGSAKSFLQGAGDEKTWPAAGAALPGWQAARNSGGMCLREKKRGAWASTSAGREGKSWVGAREEIDRRKRAPQPSQNWQKTA